MLSSFCRLACVCAVFLCACTRPSASSDYNPAQEPLTADELAQMLEISHWKIKNLPRSDPPCWGVRVVALGADGAIVNASSPQHFDARFVAEGNDQVLVGIRPEGSGFSGTLLLGARPNAVFISRFTFPQPPDVDRSYQSSLGLTWQGDRAVLIYREDARRQKRFSICLELLHGPPSISPP